MQCTVDLRLSFRNFLILDGRLQKNFPFLELFSYFRLYLVGFKGRIIINGIKHLSVQLSLQAFTTLLRELCKNAK